MPGVWCYGTFGDKYMGARVIAAVGDAILGIYQVMHGVKFQGSWFTRWTLLGHHINHLIT